MKEKEKAYEAFEKMIKQYISKQESKLNARVIKKMNAVSDDGTLFTSEAEIMDAYGYEQITEAEQRRLLEALEYKTKRPELKEDFLIHFAQRALNILVDEQSKDMELQKVAERRNKITEIEGRGNSPKYCICCGEIIGEVLGGNMIGTDWYSNHEQCVKGHVCKSCMQYCRGDASCKLNDL